MYTHHIIYLFPIIHPQKLLWETSFTMNGSTKAWIIFAVIIITVLLLWLAIYQYTWWKAGRQPKIPTVPIDDLSKYSGKWFELARYDQSFQKGCRNVTANYFLDGTDRLKVVNSCQLQDGSFRNAVGMAYKTRHKGAFAVSFFPGIYGSYHIIKYTGDISVVSNSKRSTLWILSRSTQIDDDVRKELWKWLEENGFDTSRLV